MKREEAIERIKVRFDKWALDNEDMKALNTLIPELAESEDERIREGLIALVNGTSNEILLTHAKAGRDILLAWLEKQKEQKPVDKFQEYLNASPAERRKMNMDEILGDNKGHQKTPDALTTDSNKEADTSDCKYKNLDDIAQEYVDRVRQYNPEPTWDLMQTAVCYGYHLAEQKEQKPAEVDEYKIIKKYITEDSLSSEVNKRLKECGWYVTDEKPTEWSEEDEKRLNAVIELLENTSAIHPNYSHRKLIIWLQDLRTKSHYKPSEEQMEAIERCVYYLNESENEDCDIMESLYNDLKKL